MMDLTRGPTSSPATVTSWVRGPTAGPAVDVTSWGSQAAWQAAIQPHRTTQHLDLWRNWGRSRQRTGEDASELDGMATSESGRTVPPRTLSTSSGRTVPPALWSPTLSGQVASGCGPPACYEQVQTAYWPPTQPGQVPPARWPPWTRGGRPGTESSCQIHYQLHPTLGPVLQLFRLATCSLCMAANSPTIRASASTTGPVVVPPCRLLGFGTTAAWMTDPTT